MKGLAVRLVLKQRHKRTRKRPNRYPESILCVLRFRTIEEFILGGLEALCIVIVFRVE